MSNSTAEVNSKKARKETEEGDSTAPEGESERYSSATFLKTSILSRTREDKRFVVFLTALLIFNMNLSLYG